MHGVRRWLYRAQPRRWPLHKRDSRQWHHYHCCWFGLFIQRRLGNTLKLLLTYNCTNLGTNHKLPTKDGFPWSIISLTWQKDNCKTCDRCRYLKTIIRGKGQNYFLLTYYPASLCWTLAARTASLTVSLQPSLSAVVSNTCISDADFPVQLLALSMYCIRGLPLPFFPSTFPCIMSFMREHLLLHACPMNDNFLFLIKLTSSLFGPSSFSILSSVLFSLQLTRSIRR